MAWTAAYNDNLKIVELLFSDTISGADLKNATARAIALQQEHGIKTALISVSEESQSAPAVDIYNLPDQYEKEGVSRDIRLAFILPRKPDLRETVRFYEDVCVNRGWRVQTFESREEALAWLQAPSV